MDEARRDEASRAEAVEPLGQAQGRKRTGGVYVMCRMGSLWMRTGAVDAITASRIASRLRVRGMGGHIVAADRLTRRVPRMGNWRAYTAWLVLQPAAHPWALESVQEFGSTAN